MEPNTLLDLGGGVGWIGTLLIGGIAGWIAEKLTKSDMGLIMNIVVGIIGAYIGGFLANALGLRLGEIFSGWFWGNLLVAVVGAVILLVVVKMFRGRSA
ncbi:GlsB/YeaQ/YmgE family stress response membrane protein [Taklimakanibacter albus]|uniref:GlsB/YeaQ/YmgE family stress response membrane protein n=1 Tax=Taklimakanibacter albus TaxID=2800327 RepID=A0ACC5R1N2_9HYPH|nr:GlsB/YeaQ/YmgE family stress response membrane protein [Aestuariivirga sp. YIM B02566]MBK1866548.1 GlsB/YeaQ/YmgE family stress response membrane protein [Aestuariivirga sp. YIM B02566]